MIELAGVTRLYGDHPALDALSLTIPDGQFVAVMGHNGAGKSTLLRVLAGLTRPTEGDVRIAGATHREGPDARRRMGLLAHESYLYGSLTARENLDLYGRLHGLRDRDTRVASALQDVACCGRRATGRSAAQP